MILTNVVFLAWLANDYHMIHQYKESLKYVKKFENRLEEQPLGILFLYEVDRICILAKWL